MKNTILSLEDLLARWKLLHGWEPLAEGAANTTPKLDTLLTEHIDAWYMNALLTLPPAELPLTEFAAETTIQNSANPDSASVIDIPSRCFRPVGVRLSCWGKEAMVEPYSARAAARQRNPFTTATPGSPLAMLLPTGAILIYPVCPEASLLSLTGVAHPAPGVYNLTPPMLVSLRHSTFSTKQS